MGGTSLVGVTGVVSDSVGDSTVGWETEELSGGVGGMETGGDGETTGEFASGWEVGDSDGDGFTNIEEFLNGTSPL